MVWGVFLALTTMTILNFAQMGFWGPVWLIVLAMATFGATGLIVTRDHHTNDDTNFRPGMQNMNGQGKAKRSDLALVDRLVASMSDEELAALRERLTDERTAGDKVDDTITSVGDDGEIVRRDSQAKQRRAD